jgi:hypothetical protein
VDSGQWLVRISHKILDQENDWPFPPGLGAFLPRQLAATKRCRGGSAVGARHAVPLRQRRAPPSSAIAPFLNSCEKSGLVVSDQQNVRPTRIRGNQRTWALPPSPRRGRGTERCPDGLIRVAGLSKGLPVEWPAFTPCQLTERLPVLIVLARFSELVAQRVKQCHSFSVLDTTCEASLSMLQAANGLPGPGQSLLPAPWRPGSVF